MDLSAPDNNLALLKPVLKLSAIYPDIEGQLCSRHSTLFGKLKTTFNKLYDSMQPAYYVVAKGTCQFVEQELVQLKLSMALENGVVILLARTYQQAEYFINGNHVGEQLIFTSKGTLEQGLYTMNDEMQQIIQEATFNLPPQQRYGGIMYAHSNIPENSFYYKETFLLSFYISVMCINDNLKNFTKEQLVEKMARLKFMGSRQFIEREILGFRNRKFNLTIPTGELQGSESKIQQVIRSNKDLSFVERSQLLLDMNKEFKFLFCKLDLSKDDVNYEIRRRKTVQRRKAQILKELKAQTKISTIFELFNQISQVNLSNLTFSQYVENITKSLEQIQCQTSAVHDFQILEEPQKYIFFYFRLLQVLLQQVNLISSFSNEQIGLEDLIKAIWRINSTYLKLHSQELVQLVQDLKQRLDINSCMVVNQNYLMMVVKKSVFSQLLCDVKHKMNKGELKSKSLFKIEQEEMVLQRWSSDKGIGEKMFSSVPSEGLGIFDPAEAIWFD